MCVAELLPAAPSEQDYTGLAHKRSDPSCFLPLYHPVRPSTVPAAILKNISTSPSPCPHPLLSCPIHTPPQPPCTQLTRDKTERACWWKEGSVLNLKKGAGSTTLESCSCLPSSANLGAFAKNDCIHPALQIYIGCMNNNNNRYILVTRTIICLSFYLSVAEAQKIEFDTHYRTSHWRFSHMNQNEKNKLKK